ncbi:glutathione-dependent reductase [Ruegeria marisrubri]|uniref:Glutathione-dependent reductase n=1 Tax=Ruegeria marisrubri TaxID=1685379 RepID=A0A0X3UBH1_9RHOB|nr:glutathione S-transferase family protein [Ruegeria marisrubri]KUJ84076.1 glutathione-dependent reductase [Ruegeria marisrubri]
MGLLIDGIWHDSWYDTKKSGGKFVREDAQFRNWITADGSAGPSGAGGFAAEAGRYHLYVSLACPWAHRTVIFRKLKGLEDLIGLTVVHPHMLENGWEFDKDTGGDPIGGHDFLHQVYTSVVPDYTGRVTVPVLWDKKTNTIVSNESSEIIRMFNSAFDHLTGNRLDFYPEPLRSDIDALNDFVYPRINNGVYRAGFATTQTAYEEAFDNLFAALDEIEARLATSRFLIGGTQTEADWRLFTTLIRFDAVYHGHFKTNLKRIEDYPNISHYVRDLYQTPGVTGTVDFRHIKEHYYVSQRTINPTQVVPKGPVLDYARPHDRARLAAAA